MIGDEVIVVDNGVNVRNTPGLNGTVIGSVNTDDLGTVLSGPTNTDGYIWWQIAYCGEVTGWTAENYLEKGSSVIPTAAFDQQLLDKIEQYSSTYYNSTWININENQFRAWLLAIANSEGGRGVYSAI